MIYDHCVICGSTEELQHHHVVPKVRGGGDEPTNRVTLCDAHHGFIHNRTSVASSKLIKEGQKRAKAEGKLIGRSKGCVAPNKMEIPKDVILSEYKGFNGTLNKRQLSDLLQVSRPTLNNWLKLMEVEA